MAIIIKKIRVWNGSQMMWDSFQTLALMQKTCLFMLLEPYMCTQDWSCVHMHNVYARRLILECACQGLPWLYFSKNRFIYSLKVIFFILTFLKSI